MLHAVGPTEDLAAVLSYKMLSMLETKDIPLRKMLNQRKKRIHCVSKYKCIKIEQLEKNIRGLVP